MSKSAYNLSFKQKVTMFLRLLFNGHVPYKQKFLQSHLLRRKYILSKTSNFFEKNKFEPAPLLNKKILDAGCGLNDIADELAFRGGDIIAVDTNHKIIGIAKEKAVHTGSPVDYKQLDFKNLDNDNKFDVILALDVLTRKDLKQQVEKLSVLLNDGGIIIVSGANYSTTSLLRNIIVPKFLLKMANLNVTYKYLIKLKTVKRVFDDNGFKCEHIQGADFDFFTGRWHKTDSAKVKYLMQVTKK